MRDESATMRWGSRLFGLLLALNLAAAALFAVGLLASFVFEGALLAHLAAKYADRVDIGLLVWIMRSLGAAGIVMAWPIDRCLRALAGVVRSVRDGDPFDPLNAHRATTIGWMLLVIQLGDIVFGGINAIIARTGADTVGWQPSIGGWLSVLVAFVLARVFAAGARLRDDLDGTV